MEKRTEDGTISVSIPGVIDISDSEVWDDIMGDYIYSKSKSGCKIVVDAIDSRLGVGKTSFAIGLALRIGEEVGYEIQTEDVMLSAQQFLKRFREHPGTEQPSIIILDEIVGAGGADSRRAMSNKNVNMARTFEIMRKKRVIVIMTTANYFGMDPRLRRLMDYVFTCQVSPKFHAIAYKVGTRFGTGDLRLRRMSERIQFYSLDGHPLLVELDNQKDRLLESEEFDMDKIIEMEAVGKDDSPQTLEEAENRAVDKVIRRERTIDKRTGLKYTAAGLNDVYVDYVDDWKETQGREDATSISERQLLRKRDNRKDQKRLMSEMKKLNMIDENDIEQKTDRQTYNIASRPV